MYSVAVLQQAGLDGIQIDSPQPALTKVLFNKEVMNEMHSLDVTESEMN